LGDKQTNSVNTNSNLRNIIALQDLGEGQLSGMMKRSSSFRSFYRNIQQSSRYSFNNANNDYDPAQIGTGTGLLKIIFVK
jgi:hypothetical protein